MAITIIRGARDIAAFLGTKPGVVMHLHAARQLPTFRLPHDGAPVATEAALNDWMQIAEAAALLP